MDDNEEREKGFRKNQRETVNEHALLDDWYQVGFFLHQGFRYGQEKKNLFDIA